MSDAPASPGRSRLRVWLWLAGAFLGLVLGCLAVGWFWIEDDSDIRAVEAAARAAGVDIEVHPQPPTGPVRLARARGIDAAVRAVRLDGGQHWNYRDGSPLTAEFRAVHAGISSQAVCAVARDVVGLGGEPIVVAADDRRLWPSGWGRLFNNRMLIADGVELELCLAANRIRIDMTCGRGDNLQGWSDLWEMCSLLPYRLADRREQLLPSAAWLEARAAVILEGFPAVVRTLVAADFNGFRDGERALMERGTYLPGWMQHHVVIAVVMRKERAALLDAEVDWLRFLAAHPLQPRRWLDEADRRLAAVATRESWFEVEIHRQLLFLQHPLFLQRWMATVLYARLLAAELRGAPWPVDLCDPAGGPLRRWEKDGRLVGAYSVGADGLDSGGMRSRDILFRLYPEPPAAAAAP